MSRGLSCAFVMLVLLWLAPLHGQQAFIYPIQQLDSQQEPPTYAEISQAIALDSAQLNNIYLGAYLSLQISDSRQIQLQVVTLDRYVNGDRVIGAEGRDGDPRSAEEEGDGEGGRGGEDAGFFGRIYQIDHRERS